MRPYSILGNSASRLQLGIGGDRSSDVVFPCLWQRTGAKAPIWCWFYIALDGIQTKSLSQTCWLICRLVPTIMHACYEKDCVIVILKSSWDILQNEKLFDSMWHLSKFSPSRFTTSSSTWGHCLYCPPSADPDAHLVFEAESWRQVAAATKCGSQHVSTVVRTARHLYQGRSIRSGTTSKCSQ